MWLGSNLNGATTGCNVAAVLIGTLKMIVLRNFDKNSPPILTKQLLQTKHLDTQDTPNGQKIRAKINYCRHRHVAAILQ